jgi:hypothetical protein
MAKKRGRKGREKSGKNQYLVTLLFAVSLCSRKYVLLRESSLNTTPHLLASKARRSSTLCSNVSTITCTRQDHVISCALCDSYKHTYANPTPMSTTEELSQWISSFKNSVQAPRCRRRRCLPLKV